MNLQKFSSQSDFIIASVERVVSACQKDGQVYVGISGGNTPKPLYQALATNSVLDFERIEWYLVDERYVPLDHPDSNYKMIMEAFGAAQPEFSEHLHYFDTSLPPDEAAKKYEEELNKILEQKFDVVFLGLGSDGHTASLFPGSPILHESERLAIATVNEKAPNPPRPLSGLSEAGPPMRERLTLTWPIIMKSREVVLLVSGAEKKKILDELQNSSKTVDELPAKKLLEHSNLNIFYLT